MHYSGQDGAYSPGRINYAMAQGPMPIAVFGQPFGGPNDAETVRAKAVLPGWIIAPTADRDGRNPLQIVMISNPKPGASLTQACTEPAGLAGPFVEPARIMAHVCEGGRSLSWAYASAPMFAGPNDPAINAFLSHLMAQLFPPHEEDAMSVCDLPGALC